MRFLFALPILTACTSSSLVSIDGGFVYDSAAPPQATTYVQNAITQSGDANASFLALPTQDGSDGYGCDYHPSVARQAKMGAALAAHLQQKLSW